MSRSKGYLPGVRWFKIRWLRARVSRAASSPDGENLWESPLATEESKKHSEGSIRPPRGPNNVWG